MKTRYCATNANNLSCFNIRTRMINLSETYLKPNQELNENVGYSYERTFFLRTYNLLVNENLKLELEFAENCLFTSYRDTVWINNNKDCWCKSCSPVDITYMGSTELSTGFDYCTCLSVIYGIPSFGISCFLNYTQQYIHLIRIKEEMNAD